MPCGLHLEIILIIIIILMMMMKNIMIIVPSGLHLNRVVARDEKQPDLPFELLVIRTL